MQKKPTETGTFDKVLNKLRSIANGLTGGARSAVDSASTTAKSAVESASNAAVSAGAAIKKIPAKPLPLRAQSSQPRLQLWPAKKFMTAKPPAAQNQQRRNRRLKSQLRKSLQRRSLQQRRL